MTKSLVSDNITISQNIQEGRVIQHVAYLHGYDITIKQAIELWGNYSEKEFDSFKIFDFRNYDLIWIRLRRYFEQSGLFDNDKMMNVIKPNKGYSYYEIMFNLKKSENIIDRFSFLLYLKSKKKEKVTKEKTEKFRADSETLEHIKFCMQYFKENKSEMIRSAIKLLFNSLKDINCKDNQNE